MSSTRQDPVLIPSQVQAGREETIVLEFPRNLPTTGFITLTFYDEQTKVALGCVPTAQLGARTLKANFPNFKSPGRVEVSIQFTREEKPQFPRFHLQVLSPLEAAAKLLGAEKWEASLSVLSALLAFLAQSSERWGEGEREAYGDVDGVLCGLLHSVNPVDLVDWRLGPLLSGVYNWEDNLLHLCMKEGLSETALQLLQPQHITGKADYLLQRSSRDSKTAVELAHRQGMARVAEMADILMAGRNLKAQTPKDNRKRNKGVPRASSMDTNLNFACEEPMEQSQTATTPKKKGKFKQFFRGHAKEKEPKPSASSASSAHRPLSATSQPHEDSDSPATCSPDSGSVTSQVFSPAPGAPPTTHLAPPTHLSHASPSHGGGDTARDSNQERDLYALAGHDESSAWELEKFRSVSVNREQMLPLPHELSNKPPSDPTNFAPSSQGVHFAPDIPQLPPRSPDDLRPPITPEEFRPTRSPDELQPLRSPDNLRRPKSPDDLRPLRTTADFRPPMKTPDELRPPVSEATPPPLREQHEGMDRRSSSDKGQHEAALTAAVSDLIKRSIFVGEVVQEHRWAGGSGQEFTVKVGERVYVIEETGEGFRGVCRNRYKTFPKDTLRIMTTTEIQGGKGFSDDESEGEVEEDVLYKEPRNVPRVEDSLSEEEGEDHYKIPRDVLRAYRSDSDDNQEIYNVPRSVLRTMGESEENDEEIYKVPRRIHEILPDTDSDEHDYELPPGDLHINIEGELNNILHNLPEEHYMKVPSRELLEKHSTASPAPQTNTAPQTNPGPQTNPAPQINSRTGSPAVDRLLATASSRKPARTKSPATTNQPKVDTQLEHEADNIYDYPPSPTPSPPERRKEDNKEEEEAGNGGNIYDQILPVSSPRRESLKSGANDMGVASSHVETTYPDDDDNGNIYDLPIDPSSLRRESHDQDGNLPTVYDELLDVTGNNNVPSSQQPLPPPPAPTSSSSSSLGRDWKPAAIPVATMSMDVDKRTYSPKTQAKTMPGRLGPSASRGVPNSLGYGDSGPTSEPDQKYSEPSIPSASVPSGLPPRHLERKGQYEEVPSCSGQDSGDNREGSDNKKEEPEVISAYGKVTSGRGGKKTSGVNLPSAKPAKSSSVSDSMAEGTSSAGSGQQKLSLEDLADNAGMDFETKEQPSLRIHQQHENSESHTRGPCPLPPEVQRGPHPLPDQRGPHPLPDQRGSHPLPDQRGPHPLPDQRGLHPLPDQRGPHPLPDQRGPHPLPDQRGPHPLPDQRGPHPLPDQRGPHPLPDQRGPHPLPFEAHNEQPPLPPKNDPPPRENANKPTPAVSNTDLAGARLSPLPSPKPKRKANRKSAFPISDEPTKVTKPVPIPDEPPKVTKPVPIPDEPPKGTKPAPVPTRRTRAPTTPILPNSSPVPVPKPRRHMTDTLPPPAVAEPKSRTLERPPSHPEFDEDAVPKAKTLDRSHQSPRVTGNRKKPPTVAPKPPSPDTSRRHINGGSPELLPRASQLQNSSLHSVTGGKPPARAPVVGPKPKHHVSNSPPAVRRKPHPLPPVTSPKTGRGHTSPGTLTPPLGAKSPRRKRSSTSVTDVNSSPPLPPKPFSGKR